MNTKEMLDKIVKIIARTDVDRTLALFFMNTARRAVLRENTIRKFMGYRTVAHMNGVIDSSGIKLVRTIEYLNAENAVTKLSRLASIEEAREKGYNDFAITGSPKYYLEMGAELWLLPVPTEGTIKIYGEFWPNDLVDDVSSSDILTAELPEAFIYLTAAEYLDYFDELEKAQYWRQKGMAIIEPYLKQDAKQHTYGVGLTSDPLGNGGLW